MTAAPARDEAAPYFFNYIDLVPAGDIVALLAAQLEQTLPLLATITEEQSRHRYAPDKWSLRELLGHLNDCERLFTFRALWFARGFDSPLPSFDDKVAARGAVADRIAWHDHVEEFRALRTATIALFRGLPADAWDRRGIASGTSFTVRALAYIAEGHVTHHLAVIRDRYLQPTKAR
jgi:hypothetical protein